MGGYRAFLTAVLVAWAAITVAGQGSGQLGTCAEKLTGCYAYLNATTTPPPSCCNPLKEAVTNEKACLCNLYANPSLLKTLGVNITQALNLPNICKISSDPDPANFCKGTAPSGSPSSGSGSTPSSTVPSGGSSPGTGSGSKKNSASTVTGTGLVSSLFMFVAYVLLY